MKQYMLAHMVEKPVLNEEFAKWPLHITVLPWFKAKSLPAEFFNRLDDLFFDQSSFDVTIGKVANFGPLNNISVHLVNNNEKLMALHERCMTFLANQPGMELVAKRHTGQHYQPHITDKKMDLLYENQVLSVDGIDVIESISEWPHKKRKSIYRIEFK